MKIAIVALMVLGMGVGCSSSNPVTSPVVEAAPSEPFYVPIPADEKAFTYVHEHRCKWLHTYKSQSRLNYSTEEVIGSHTDQFYDCPGIDTQVIVEAQK